MGNLFLKTPRENGRQGKSSDKKQMESGFEL